MIRLILFRVLLFLFFIFASVSLACISSTNATEEIHGTGINQPTQDENSTTIPTPTLTSTVSPTGTATNQQSQFEKPTIILTPSLTSTPSPAGIATINVSRVNLRIGPGTNYAIAGKAESGDIFPIYGKISNGDWLWIDWSQPVWVATELVEIGVDMSIIPVVKDNAGTTVTADILNSPTPEIVVTEPISTSEAIGTTTPTPVAVKARVEVVNLTSYQSTSGFVDLIFMGEVLNLRNEPLKKIDVTIELLDANGNLLDFESGRVKTPWGFNLWNTGVLYPSLKAPYRVSFDDPGSWTEFNVSIDYSLADRKDIENHHREVEVINDTGRPIDDILYNYQITGEVKNTGFVHCYNTWIVATLFDNDGNVIGINETVTDIDTDNDKLVPGETVPFKIEMYARGEVAYYELIFFAIGE